MISTRNLQLSLLTLVLSVQTHPIVNIELNDGIIEIDERSHEALIEFSKTFHDAYEEKDTMVKGNMHVPAMSVTEFQTILPYVLTLKDYPDNVKNKINTINNLSTLASLIQNANYLDVSLLIEYFSNRIAEIVITNKNLQNSFLATGKIDSLEKINDIYLQGIITKKMFEKKPAILADLLNNYPVQSINYTATNSAALSFDGSKIATTSSRDNTAKIRNTNNGELISILEGEEPIISIAFNPNKDTEVITINNNGIAEIWDTNTRKITYVIDHEMVGIALFSHDGSKIMTVSRNNTVKIWDTTDYSALDVINHNNINVAIFSFDDTKIATGSQDGTIKIWLIDDSSLLHTLNHKDSPVKSIEFSSDDTKILSAIDTVVYTRNGKRIIPINDLVKVWNIKDYTLLFNLNQNDLVNSAVFSPDNTKIITASEDKTAKIWNTENGNLVYTLNHNGPISSAVFSPNNTKIITASRDKTAKIWNSENGSLINTLNHNNEVNSAIFSSDGTKIVTTSKNNNSNIWYIEKLIKLQNNIDYTIKQALFLYLFSQAHDKKTLLENVNLKHIIESLPEETLESINNTPH